MSGRLIAENGILNGLVLALDRGEEWVIGRDPEACQLVIDETSISRRHLLCKATPEGIIVENLSHTNPTQINDKELTEPRLLKNHDTIKIGDIPFRYFAEEEEAPEKEADLQKELFMEPITHTLPEESKEQESPELEFDDEPESPKLEFDDEPKNDTIFDESEIAEEAHLAEINFGFIDSGRWLLKVIAGPNNGAEFPMQPGSSYLLGTDPNTCDVVFQDSSVSRQHARVTVDSDDSLSIEDLNSRNGTAIDGSLIKEKKPLSPNALVTIGHTSFTIFDREGVMETIVSPLIPKIIKTLVEETPKQNKEEESKTTEQPAHTEPQKEKKSLAPYILIGILVGIFIIVGIGTSTLFKTEAVPVVISADIEQELNAALAPFKNIKYTYNKNTGQLLLVGHVLTPFDRSQLISALQDLSFIKNIDDKGIVIDEYVWKETNQIIEHNPQWKGISITAPSPGHFVVTGYLREREQAYDINDYLSSHFPYPHLLENQLIVEDDVVSSAESLLFSKGFRNLSILLTNGDLIISGIVPIGGIERIDELIPTLKEIRGVHTIHNVTVAQQPEQTFVDISNKYRVSGTSTHNKNPSAVINGRILMKGDQLDGMTITAIQPNAILLEKDNTQYKISY